MTAPDVAVTVIVLSYDRPDYLREAIASALAQTYRAPFEVLVADDASPSIARIRDVVQSFGDARLSLIERERNAGVVANLLEAVRRSRGRYVAILCDDDFWTPRFLDRLVEALDANPRAALAFSDYWITDAEGRINGAATDASTRHWHRDTLQPGLVAPFVREALVVRAVQPVMATVLRKSAIDWHDFPEETGPAYDLWIAYVACRDGGAAYYEPQRLTHYRVHGSAQTFVAGVTWNAGKAYIYGRILADERLKAYRAHFRDMLSFAELRTGISLLRQGRSREARRRIRAAVAGGQANARAAAALALSLFPGVVARRLFALRGSP